MDNIESLNGFCSGCGACAVICPVNAILISMSDEGFYTAQINSSKCVECGKCSDVCIRGGIRNTVKLTSGTVIAAQSKDKNTIMFFRRDCV